MNRPVDVDRQTLMNAYVISREGTWLYDGQIPTGVRVVACATRWGSGDDEDPPDIRDDVDVPGFDVLWATPTSPFEFSSYASAVFLTLEEAIAHVEDAAWTQGTLKWSSLSG